MKPEILDVVQLLEAIPTERLAKGARGVIVHAYSAPREAYEVEFCDEIGETLAQVALTPDQFRVVRLNSRESAKVA